MPNARPPATSTAGSRRSSLDGLDVVTLLAADVHSYADFVWGLPAQTDPLYPSLGLSSNPVEGEKALKVDPRLRENPR